MKATYLSAAALAALPSLGAAQLLDLAAAPQVTTGYSTTTSTRTVLHVITETHFSSVELETSTELIPVVTPTPSPINIHAAVATPVSSFPTLSVVANSTQGVNGTSKASQTAGAAGVNAAAASASASPAPTGAASALQISGAAVAAMAAAAGFFVL
ncbi:uncharacterized protein J3D65DRAFT_604236 [Phyllosticta citribraziliensis]|uniref:Uncharacterized protein n=1 Tax=Phyllosticta citribraziliensis TaxID=989973 RepID=A0ABR1LHU2_9PEZI